MAASRQQIGPGCKSDLCPLAHMLFTSKQGARLVVDLTIPSTELIWCQVHSRTHKPKRPILMREDRRSENPVFCLRRATEALKSRGYDCNRGPRSRARGSRHFHPKQPDWQTSERKKPICVGFADRLNIVCMGYAGVIISSPKVAPGWRRLLTVPHLVVTGVNLQS